MTSTLRTNQGSSFQSGIKQGNTAAKVKDRGTLEKCIIAQTTNVVKRGKNMIAVHWTVVWIKIIYVYCLCTTDKEVLASTTTQGDVSFLSTFLDSRFPSPLLNTSLCDFPGDKAGSCQGKDIFLRRSIFHQPPLRSPTRWRSPVPACSPCSTSSQCHPRCLPGHSHVPTTGWGVVQRCRGLLGTPHLHS